MCAFRTEGEFCFLFKNGICLTAFRHVPEKLLRPPAALEVSKLFSRPHGPKNLGGLLRWIKLSAGAFDLLFSSDTTLLLQRERFIKLV